MKPGTYGGALEPAITPSYAPLVLACAMHGIGKTTAFQLVREGKLDTFKIGARTYVKLDSLRTLPTRLADEAGAMPIRPPVTRTVRRTAATRGVQA